MKRSIRHSLAALAFACLFSGAAFPAQPQSAGFIDDVPTLTEVPGVIGAWGWENRETARNYDRFIFDTVEIFLADDSPYKGINGTQMEAISTSLIGHMQQALEPDYPMVSQPGERVMRMSLALTNVKITKKKKNILNFTPVGLVVGGIRSIADSLSNVSLEGAQVEAIAADSVTGERHFVRIVTKPFVQAAVSEDKMSWNALEKAFSFYAKNMRRQLDELRAEQGKGRM